MHGHVFWRRCGFGEWFAGRVGSYAFKAICEIAYPTFKYILLSIFVVSTTFLMVCLSVLFFLLKYTSVALTVNGILSLLSLTSFVLVVSWLCSRHVTHVLLSLFNAAAGMCGDPFIFCYQQFLFFQHNRISKIKQNRTADTYSTSQGSIKREGEREGQQEHKSHSFK